MADKAKFRDTLWAQPETLDLAYRSVLSSLESVSLPLWKKGDTVAAIAMGASSHSAHALVHALMQAGMRGVNITASDLVDAPDGFQPADSFLLVSESGRSPEVVNAARKLTPGRRVGITAFPEASISAVVDYCINLGGFPDSRVYVTGYTATLMAYSLMLHHSGVVSAATPVVTNGGDLVRRALRDYEAVAATIAEKLQAVTNIDCVGHGFSYSSATESALIFREAVRLPASAFDTFQYLHGPMQSGKKGTALLVFGDGRELPMIQSQVEAGVEVILVTAASEWAIRQVIDSVPPNLSIVRVPDGVKGFGRAIVEIVLIQLIADASAVITGNVIEDYIYRQADTKLLK
jgi:fructoselysine-6-P-deglycase FrlB-like protein